MISVDEARDVILSSIPILPSEEVALLDALYRVLDEDVYSDSNIPPFDNSAMDGYAIRAADVGRASAENPVILDVLEDLAAGYVAGQAVGEGQAIRIMTGAPMPQGADSVVKVEETERSNGSVKVFRSVKRGENVRLAGEDVRVGELVLTKGKLLGPGDVGMLASIGKASIKVIRRPRVAVIATGDELVDVGEPLAPGKIRNSNAYSIGAQVLEAGAIPLMVGIARDRRNDLVEKIERGLEADILITSGGVSVGDYDLVKQVLAELGEVVLWKVAMKPGKPLAFGVIQDKPLFGLHGYPTSSMVSFEQFVRPAILKMSGRSDLKRPEIQVVLEDRVVKKPGRRHYLRAVLERKDGEVHAKLTSSQKSGSLKPMTVANALLVIPEDATAIEPGEKVTAQLIRELT